MLRGRSISSARSAPGSCRHPRRRCDALHPRGAARQRRDVSLRGDGGASTGRKNLSIAVQCRNLPLFPAGDGGSRSVRRWRLLSPPGRNAVIKPLSLRGERSEGGEAGWGEGLGDSRLRRPRWNIRRFNRHPALPRNLRPMAASISLLPPGEGGPEGRMREETTWFQGHNPRAMGPGGLSQRERVPYFNNLASRPVPAGLSQNTKRRL